MKVVTFNFSFEFRRRKFKASMQVFKPADKIMFRVAAKAPKDTQEDIYIFYLSKENNKSVYWYGSDDHLNAISAAIIKAMAKPIKEKYKTGEKLVQEFQA